MISVLASQLRNVKVETCFIELLGLGVPGRQSNRFSGSRNQMLFPNLSLLFSNVGRTALSLKPQKMWARKLGAQNSISKKAFALQRQSPAEPGAALLPVSPAAHRPRAGPCPHQGLPSATSTDTKRRFHMNSFPVGIWFSSGNVLAWLPES